MTCEPVCTDTARMPGFVLLDTIAIHHKHQKIDTVVQTAKTKINCASKQPQA
jgi:hypothetical protein